MDLEIYELSEVCSVLRTYISQAKRVNKKNRLKIALKKLETELSYKESKISHSYKGYVTFKVIDNLCPSCGQLKHTTTFTTRAK
tara:strand:+ start:51 stop:302 length:252 start_codon:yes stop_codon:yes gene_type:complete